jgi:hypothetical protein
MMSEHKKEGTRMKARYLAQAYRTAIEEIQFKTWNDYCREAINHLAAVHIVNRNTKVLERWSVEFRRRKTFFVNVRGKGTFKCFPRRHPVVGNELKEYGHENLSELSIER